MSSSSSSSSNNNDRRSHLQSLASILLGVTTATATSLTPTTPLSFLLPPTAHAIGDDEYDVQFKGKESLGLAVEDFGKNGKYRTYISKIVRGSQAVGKGIRLPALIVAINGRNVEGLPKKLVVQLIREAQKDETMMITFRDPAKFMEMLTEKNGPGAMNEGEEVTTQLAPETKAREAQTLTVKKTYVPEICQTGAKYGDLLEIKYATSLEDGTFLDSSGMATPGRAGDATIYFVLGDQAAGLFPKSWDLALNGACVGEKRLIRTPSVLAYGPKGLKKRGIPPDATIIYNVEIIGINGNNIPR